MNEPMQGQKTNILAAAFAIMQALSAAGVIDAGLVEAAGQVFAGLFAITLGLKARRASKEK